MIFSITDYGAAQSDALNTRAIQSAIDACFSAGGGEVIIPAGFWRTGSFRLRSRVTLRLMSGAYLEASVDPADYDSFRDDMLEPLKPEDPDGKKRPQRSASRMSHWNNAIIRAIDADDVAIIGEPYSVIDGGNCYDPTNEENYRGPHGINMWNCKNIKLSG